MHTYPNVSAKLILRAENGVCMLVHRDGNYDFPGGQMKWGESPEQTLKRELMEEIAYQLPVEPRFLDIWNYISKDNSRHTIFLYYFAVLEKRPVLYTAGEEAEAGTTVTWLDKQEMKIAIKDEAFLRRIFAESEQPR